MGEVDESNPTPSPKKILRKDFEKLEKNFKEGYDSDGYSGPYVPQEEQEFKENPLLEKVIEENKTIEENEDDTVPIIMEDPEATTAVDVTPKWTEDQLKAMTVSQLKELLRGQQMKLGGKKEVLIERLLNPTKEDKSSLNRKEKDSDTATKKDSDTATKRDGMNGFPPSAYWEPLKPDTVAVEEPLNPNFAAARAPTIAEQEGEYVPVKFNFSHTFDRPVFAGRYSKPVLD